jgi:Na+/proline symporter
MYLIALDNIGYIAVTLFFAILFGIAYKIRETNFTATADMLNSIVGNIGIIELVGYAWLGALFGFSALIAILGAIIVTEFIRNLWEWLFLLKPDFKPELILRKNSIVSNLIVMSLAILKVICLIGLASITILITYKLLHSLLGWNFVNSIVGVFSFTLIYMMFGGGLAIYYNRIIQFILTCTILFTVTWLAFSKLGGLNVVMHNLNNLAIKEHLDAAYYTKVNMLSASTLIIFLGTIFYICWIKWLSATREQFSRALNIPKARSSVSQLMRSLSLPLKLCVVFLVVFIGVIAIATPINAHNSDEGSQSSQIVTYQAQLPDGQVGYVVQAIGDDGGGLNATNTTNSKVRVMRGIIPPIIDNKTNMVTSKYDYFLTSTVVVKYYLDYLPKNFMALLVILILAMFMYSFSGYLAVITKITMQDILCKLDKPNEFIKSNAINALWVSRGCIFATAIIALLCALFCAIMLNLHLS